LKRHILLGPIFGGLHIRRELVDEAVAYVFVVFEGTQTGKDSEIGWFCFDTSNLGKTFNVRLEFVVLFASVTPIRFPLLESQVSRSLLHDKQMRVQRRQTM
jgi:hypothetical protein